MLGLRNEQREMIEDYLMEHRISFYRLAYTYTHNEQDAQDIVQNAMIKALKHEREIKNLTGLKSWCYRIVVNESLDFLRKSKRQLISEEELEDNESIYLEKGFNLHDDLYEAIDLLSEDVQTIIKLRYFEDMDLITISSIMDMNLNTVKAKLYRGLKALKLNLEKERMRDE